MLLSKYYIKLTELLWSEQFEVNFNIMLCKIDIELCLWETISYNDKKLSKQQKIAMFRFFCYNDKNTDKKQFISHFNIQVCKISVQLCA